MKKILIDLSEWVGERASERARGKERKGSMENMESKGITVENWTENNIGIYVDFFMSVCLLASVC